MEETIYNSHVHVKRRMNFEPQPMTTLGDFAHYRPLGQWLRLCLMAGLLAGASGCSPSGGSRENQAAGQAAASDIEINRVLSELTQVVRKYSVEQRQAPQSLDTLVAKGYLAHVPTAPDGKRFAITKNLEVELADR